MLRWIEGEEAPGVWVLADNPGAEEAFYVACGFERGDANDQGVLMVLNTART